jgi:hypothetical protein
MSTRPVSDLPERLDQALAFPAGAPASHVEAEIAPLITLAGEVTSTLQPPPPSGSYVAAAKARLLQRATPGAAARSRRKPARRARLLWRLAAAGMFLVLATLGTGLGVAQASAGALPGDPWYGAKRGLEQIQLALAFGDEAEASLRVQLATRRLEETQTVLEAGRTSEAASLLGEYQAQVDSIVRLASQASIQGQLHGLQRALAAHQLTLERIQARASASDQEGLGGAIVGARHSQEVLETLIGGGSPSDLAPGQRDRPNDKPERGRGHGKDRSARGRGQSNNQPERTPGPPP